MEFHSRFALCVALSAGSVQGSGTGVNQMDDTIGSQTCKFLTGHALHGIGTPISTYIGEDLGTIGQQMAE